MRDYEPATVTEHYNGRYVVKYGPLGHERQPWEAITEIVREDDLSLDNRPIYTCEEPPAMSSGATDAKPRPVNAFQLYQAIVDELRECQAIHGGHPWTYDFCIESLKVIPEKSRQDTLEIMEINGLIVRGETNHFNAGIGYPAADHTLWRAADEPQPIPDPNVAIASFEPRPSDTEWNAFTDADDLEFFGKPKAYHPGTALSSSGAVVYWPMSHNWEFSPLCNYWADEYTAPEPPAIPESSSPTQLSLF